MPITKLDLYKPEWLELVFDHRNTDYGAYDLRKHYSDNVAKALGATILAVLCFFVGYGFVLKHKAAPIIDEHRVIPVNITIQPPTVRPPVTPPKPRVEPPRTNTVKFPPPVLTDDQHATNPPTIDEAKLAVIGQQNIKGKQDDGLSDLGISDGPPAKAVTESTEPVDMRVVEVMPEPVGGAAAWSKFLQKNVRFPAPAQEAGVGGRVWLSFIVEKDGSISNITVERGAGYGMDEEAVRVLKLAPAWKPGIQNGHPVRVRFNLPFNFQVPTE